MRPLWLVALAACTQPGVQGDTSIYDTATGALAPRGMALPDHSESVAARLEDCEDPGYCGCDWTGYDLDATPGDETCVHNEATVDASAILEPGAIIDRLAFVDAGATIGAGARVGIRARVGAGSIVDTGAFLGRRAQLGSNTHLGPDSVLGREAKLGNDVDASPGSLFMGYAAEIGDRSQLLGPNIVLGNLVQVGPDAILHGTLVMARDSSLGARVEVEQNVTIGPEVQIGNDAFIGEGTRIRKGVSIGPSSTLGTNTRVGRDTTIEDHVTIERDSVLRADVYVGANASVAQGSYLPRGTRIDAVDPEIDLPPVVEITSPGDGADVSSGSIQLQGTVTDDRGISTVAVRIDDGAATTLTLVNGTFNTTLTVPDEASTIEVYALDTAGQRGNDRLFVNDCFPGLSYDFQWTGSSSADWDDPSNWSSTSGELPTATDDVFICGTVPTQPQLGSHTEVRRLSLSGSATLDLRGYDLTANSHVVAGTITGSGSVVLPNNTTIRGTVSNLEVRGRANLSGYLHATGNVDMLSGDALYVGTQELEVDGTFTQTIGASNDGLRLTSGGVALFNGNAVFNGSAAMGTSQLNGGWMHFRRNLTVQNTSTAVFNPGSTLTVFDGTNNQYVYMPSASQTGSHFQNVVINKPDESANRSVNFNAGHPMVVMGTLIIQDDSSLSVIDGYVHQDLTMNGTARASGTTLTLNSRLKMGEDAFLSPSTLEVLRYLPELDGTFNSTTLSVAGNVSMTEDWAYDVNNFYIAPAGRLYVNSNRLAINGSFEQDLRDASNGGLRMTSDSEVHVTGQVEFNGTVNMPTSHLNGGTFTLERNLTVQDTNTAVLDPVNTTFVFAGTQTQYVYMPRASSTSSHFQNVIVRKPDDSANRYLTFNTGYPMVVMGTLTVEDDSHLSVVDGYVHNNVDIQGTGRISGTTLELYSQLTMDPASTLATTNLDVLRYLPEFDGTFTGSNLRVTGTISMSEDWDHSVYNFAIQPSGRLYVNSNRLAISGNFEQDLRDASNGGLRMTSGSEVHVTGQVEFNGTVDMPTSHLNGGTFTLERNLTVQDTNTAVLDPVNTTFVFAGTQVQYVYMPRASSTSSHFQNVIVRKPDNNADRYLTFNNGYPMVVMGTLTVEDDSHLSVVDGYVHNNVDIQGTGRISGTTLELYSQLTMDPASTLATTNLDVLRYLPEFDGTFTGSNLRVTGAINMSEDWDHSVYNFAIQPSGRLYVGSHTLSIGGNFEQDLRDATNGGLRMTSGSEVVVTGSTEFNGTVDMPTSHLNGGNFHVRGHLTAQNTTRSVLDPNSTTFVFDGPSTQYVYMPSASQSGSHLQNVVVSKASESSNYALTFNNGYPMVVMGGLTIADDSRVSAIDGYVHGNVDLQGTATLSGHTVELYSQLSMAPTSSISLTNLDVLRYLPELAGNFSASSLRVTGAINMNSNWTGTANKLYIAPAGRLTVGSYELDLTGTFEQDLANTNGGLRMSSGSVVRVSNDALFNATYSMPTNHLNGGDFYVGRNLTVQNTARPVLLANATTFHMDGSGTQTANLGYGGTSYSRINNLVIDSGSRTYLRLGNGDLRFTNLTVNTAATIYHPTTVSGTLSVPTGASIGHSGQTLTVNGTCNIQGTVTPGATCN